MMKNCKKKSIGFKYAFAGIAFLLKNEHNMLIHCFVALIVIAVGFILKFTLHEWIAILLCIGGVLSAEAFNTAIEKIANFVCNKHNPEIGIIKDIAAGAVLIISLISVVVGVIILISKLDII